MNYFLLTRRPKQKLAQKSFAILSKLMLDLFFIIIIFFVFY